MILEQLANCFRADKLSSFQKLRFGVRQRQNSLINRIILHHGKVDLSKIKTRTIFEWYAFWSNDGKKLASGHSLIKQLRVLFGYGLTLLEDQECQRLRVIPATLKFPKGKRREHKLNIDHDALIICERTNKPWRDFDFRTEWRKLADVCDIPKVIFQMDTRAGAISEAFIAGANPDFIRASATHSDLAMTQNYNRGFQLEKSSDVMVKRINSRI